MYCVRSDLGNLLKALGRLDEAKVGHLFFSLPSLKAETRENVGNIFFSLSYLKILTWSVTRNSLLYAILVSGIPSREKYFDSNEQLEHYKNIFPNILLFHLGWLTSVERWQQLVHIGTLWRGETSTGPRGIAEVHGQQGLCHQASDFVTAWLSKHLLPGTHPRSGPRRLGAHNCSPKLLAQRTQLRNIISD